MKTATVVITTRNRKADLAVAVKSAVEQSAAPEVFVIDDGSTDGTADLIREQFPTVRLERAEQSAGYIVQRNRAAELASGEVIFSIDDDAAFTTPRVIEQTLAEFASPRIGAIAVPYINVNTDRLLRFVPPQLSGVYALPSYVGTAHAVRRDVFLKLGGYRPYLVHQGEETDFCLRMLAAGYIVAAGRADVIHHFESPRRDTRRVNRYARRNDILFGWHNVPAADLPLRWGRAVAGSVRHAMKRGQLWHTVQGLAWGFASVPMSLRRRSPVPRPIYHLHRRLISEGMLPLEEIESLLPPLPTEH